MFKILFSLSLVLSVGSQALAGFERGNGGNIVACLGEPAPLFLDYYLFKRDKIQRVLPSIKPGMGGYIDKAFSLAYPLTTVNSKRADKILRSILQFDKNVQYVDYMPPSYTTTDEGFRATLLIARCTPYQLIYQTHIAENPLDTYYIVSRPRWVQLNNDQKAVAVVHEAILREYMGLEGFYDKLPIQNIVDALLTFELLQDKSGLVAVKEELSKLDNHLILKER